jgi:flagellar hook-basal body complex protein FliE
MNINPIQPIRLPELTGLTGRSETGGGNFASSLESAINQVNSAQRSAQSGVERFLNGENIELHDVALEQQKAAVTFDLFLQVRNKVVQAYQEVMRMQM